MNQQKVKPAKRYRLPRRASSDNEKRRSRLAAVKLLKLEKSAQESTSGPIRSGSAMKVITISLIVLAVLAGLIWILLNGRSERDQYVELRSAISSIGERIETNKNVQQSPVKIDRCRHWTIGVGEAGWNCSSSLELRITDGGNISEAKGELKSAILTNSTFMLKDAGSERESYMFMGKIPCEMLVSSKAISITFICEGGAEQSWYENNEMHTYPGSEAWRLIK